jgi:hypothetical protein
MVTTNNTAKQILMILAELLSLYLPLLNFSML